jgi:hypothetical protein
MLAGDSFFILSLVRYCLISDCAAGYPMGWVLVLRDDCLSMCSRSGFRLLVVLGPKVVRAT